MESQLRWTSAMDIDSKSNCARPPHPKGMGYASGRALRLDGIQKQSHHRFI